MLPHAVENSVRITMNQRNPNYRQSALQISNGIVVLEQVQTSDTDYTIENSKNESYRAVVEYNHCFGNSEAIVGTTGDFEIVDQEKLPDGSGYRLYFEIKSGQSGVLTVTETLLTSSDIALNIDWITRTLIRQNAKFGENKDIKACLEVQRNIDEETQTIGTLNAQKASDANIIAELRNNIQAVGGNNPKAQSWIEQLEVATKKNIEANASIEQTQARIKSLRTELFNKINALSFEWKEGTKK
jgi:hypothetical protein